MNEDSLKQIWKKADCVCFDVDSTVCQDEGIDVLADFLGVSSQVKEWTNKAMGGDVTFQQALSARLEIIKPSTQSIDKFNQSHKPLLTKGIKTLIQKLKARNCAVYLVSGGLQEIIEPVARILDINTDHIYANRIKYFYNGEYAGFDENQPTSRSQGKPKVCDMLKSKHGYKNLVMIGDGATDMEASPPADAFIGFGGNVVREKVKNGAKWFVNSFDELLQELN